MIFIFGWLIIMLLIYLMFMCLHSSPFCLFNLVIFCMSFKEKGRKFLFLLFVVVSAVFLFLLF